ncbi:hypothetical protein F5883DRAFT_633631 [Diaporthe sp. PMI_573]|nr:hypothetical protein F5883DRAFT_633631 [Diaporthaceae sp. PMI_573]
MSSRRLWLKLSSSLEHRNRAANSTAWRLLRSHGRQRFGPWTREERILRIALLLLL